MPLGEHFHIKAGLSLNIPNKRESSVDVVEATTMELFARLLGQLLKDVTIAATNGSERISKKILHGLTPAILRTARPGRFAPYRIRLLAARPCLRRTSLARNSCRVEVYASPSILR
jgi:hypothetical protein